MKRYERLRENSVTKQDRRIIHAKAVLGHNMSVSPT